MTLAESTVAALLEAVHADPLDLGLRLVLADALSDAGDEEGSRFWRWTAGGNYIYFVSVTSSYVINRTVLPPSLDAITPRSEWKTSARPASDAFARLRAGWDKAREENLL